MITMRAKFRVTDVTSHGPAGESPVSEDIRMMAVTEKPFDAGGTSEDNSFAKWTPTAELTIHIQNEALIGKIKVGQKYYLDFTEAAE